MEIWETTILGRRDSQYKGPEVGAKLEVKGTVLEISNINCKLRAPHGHHHFRQLATNLEVSQVLLVLVTHCNKSRNSGKHCTCYQSFVVAKEEISNSQKKRHRENVGLSPKCQSFHFSMGVLPSQCQRVVICAWSVANPESPPKFLCPEFYQDFITQSRLIESLAM